jgi:hypothetical protein
MSTIHSSRKATKDKERKNPLPAKVAENGRLQVIENLNDL